MTFRIDDEISFKAEGRVGPKNDAFRIKDILILKPDFRLCLLQVAYSTKRKTCLLLFATYPSATQV
jgi:hypothetical protein